MTLIGPASKPPMIDDTPAVLLLSRPEPLIAELTLNRPAQRNALSHALIDALHSAFDTLARDKDVAAIVLTATGTAFSSGHDLKELTAHRDEEDGGRAFFGDTMSACSAMMQSIVGCPKPVIAAVQGPATAAGCQLVATCDLAIAGPSATFATPGVNIGLFCSTPMIALSRNLSRKRAMEMLLLGETLDAAQAADFGLVNRVAADDARTDAFAMARTIASKSRVTVATGKAAFYAQIEKPLGDAYSYASKVMVDNMMRADAKEGIDAFMAKRPPVWSHS